MSALRPPHPAPRFGQEVRAMTGLALPLAGAQLAHMGMGVVDTVLLGSLGRDALAAGGLGGAMFFTIAGAFQYALASVGILVAHARGGENPTRIGPVFRAGLLLALLGAALPAVLLWNIESFLIWIGEPPILAERVTTYVRYILYGVPAAMLLALMRFYLSAMDHPRLVFFVAIFGLIANGILDYGLIYGVWGLPEMGYLGSAAATAIVLWTMAGLSATAIWLLPDLKPGPPIGPMDWPVIGELLRLGVPIAITFSVETVLFMTAALLIGTMGETPLAAHQVTIMIAATAFMVPLAVGQAANVRVSYHMGAVMPAAARQAGFAALLLGLAFMSFTASMMMMFPQALALLFQLDPDSPNDAAVIAMVVHLLGICALFQVFDGAQAIAAGILRGYKDTRATMILAALGYWIIGFPVAWTLAFPLGYGAPGVWWGLATGLAAASVLLVLRFLHISGRLTRG